MKKSFLLQQRTRIPQILLCFPGRRSSVRNACSLNAFSVATASACVGPGAASWAALWLSPLRANAGAGTLNSSYGSPVFWASRTTASANLRLRMRTSEQLASPFQIWRVKTALPQQILRSSWPGQTGVGIATVGAHSSSHRLLLNLYPDWRVRLKLLFSFSWPSSVSTALQQWEVGGGAEEGPPFALESLHWLLHLQANLLVCLFVSFSNSARHQLVFKHFRQFLLLPAFLLTSHSSSSASAFPSPLIPSSLPQSSPQWFSSGSFQAPSHLDEHAWLPAAAFVPKQFR